MKHQQIMDFFWWRERKQVFFNFREKVFGTKVSRKTNENLFRYLYKNIESNKKSEIRRSTIWKQLR